MSTSSYPAVIDLLLAKIRALPECAEPVKVFDGIPGPYAPKTFVTIGGQVDPTEEGEVAWAELGARSTWEIYEVACYVNSWVGGTDNTGTTAGDAQKTARDNVFTIYNAIQTALLADVNLSVQNGGTPACLFQGTNSLVVHQTPVNANDDGAKGRVCQINFRVHVKARISA